MRSVLLAHLAAFAVLYAVGILYLFASLKWINGRAIGVTRALAAGGLVFLPTEALKIAAAVILYKRLRPAVAVVCAAGLLVVLFHAAPAQAQTAGGLAGIRSEIQILEAQLRAKEANEKTLLEQLENAERRIGLQKGLVTELQRELAKKQTAVKETGERLSEAIAQQAELKALVVRRIVSIYKHGKMAEWEAVASMRSFNQALVWIKYQQIILQNDKRNLRLLARKGAEVGARKNALELELSEQQKLLGEAKTETEKLEQSKATRGALLSQVRREKAPLIEQIHQKRIAYRQIEEWMAREEEQRQEEERRRLAEEKKRIEEARRSSVKVKPVKPDRPPPSAELSGRMNWPIRGSIVSRYGRHMDPQLRTWTENLGVEIEGDDGESVKAVAAGRVKRVDWLRGMGNLVFLDHGGFYTVYGHLERVTVAQGEDVPAGAEIGIVGDASGFYGSMLHFEVWKGKMHCNPETWLR